MTTRRVLELLHSRSLTIDEASVLFDRALDMARERGQMEGLIQAINLVTRFPAEPVDALLTQVKKLSHSSSCTELGNASQTRKREEVSS